MLHSSDFASHTECVVLRMAKNLQRTSRRKFMKKQASAMSSRSHVKSVVLAVLLFGLLGLVAFMARSHGQSEGGAVVTRPAAATGVVTSTKNPLQIALLHWYAANLTTQFTAGTSPYGVAFDGANIWVALNGSGKVTKLRANDGFNLGSFSVGTNPTGVAFDGANIWVANFGSNNVTKLATSGTVLGTFPAGSGPSGIAYDGANIWVTDFNSTTVTKLLATTGATTGTFTVGSEPVAVAFDGANIWVSNFSGTTVSKL